MMADKEFLRIVADYREFYSHVKTMRTKLEKTMIALESSQDENDKENLAWCQDVLRSLDGILE